MLRPDRKQNKESGSVTIEATISLTAFLFMFIMIFSIITICRAEAHIQVAIDATAKEISQYSYLYGLTGLDTSMEELEKAAGDTREEVLELAGESKEAVAKATQTANDVAGMFSAIQSLGSSGSKLSLGDLGGITESWGQIKTDVTGGLESVDNIKSRLEDMAEDPQGTMFGMARLFVSEGLDLAKSKLIAEPISRALVKKHLKRSNDDTAEAFCQSVGITPDTYLGKTSAFNGLDFSNSLLFPFGSNEIEIVVTYKVKLLQLLPFDAEFTITQQARTLGWLHGDATDAGLGYVSRFEAMSKSDALWNSEEGSKREDFIRHKEISELKNKGALQVSGETVLHTYDEASKTFTMVRSRNPLKGLESVDQVDVTQLTEELHDLYYGASKYKEDGGRSVTLKYTDENGQGKKKSIDLTGEESLVIVLVIPEDKGLAEKYAQAIEFAHLEGSVVIKPGYGTVFKDKDAETEQANPEGEN